MVSDYLTKPIRSHEQAIQDLINKVVVDRIVWEDKLVQHYVEELAPAFAELSKAECELEVGRAVTAHAKAQRLHEKGIEIPVNVHDARSRAKASIILAFKRITQLGGY